MKRVISLILALSLILSVTVFAENTEDNSYFVNSVTYSDNTLKGGSVLKANADISLYNSEYQKDFTFFTVLYKDGKINSFDVTKGTVTDNEKVTNEITLPDDTKGLTVESYLWDNIVSANALAPSSVFSSDNAEISEIYIDNNIFASGKDVKDIMEKTFISSISHTPKIDVITKDAGAKVEISKILTLPQDVDIKVTSQSGKNVKNYTLKLGIKEGKVSNAFMWGKDKDKKTPMPVDVIKDISDKVLVYGDRPIYYSKVPSELMGATVVQTPMQLLRYDEAHKDKNNADETMGYFDIDRSATVYIYNATNDLDWVSEDGYVPYKENISKKDPDWGDKESTNSGMKKTFVVNEGETKRIRIGSATSSKGQRFEYFILVKFLEPGHGAGITNVKINGEEFTDFDYSRYTYDLDFEGDTKVPEVTFDLMGFDAEYEVIKATTFPGTTKINVTSKFGEKVTYTFNFNKIENRLSELNVDGKLIDGFNRDKFSYFYTLEKGTTKIPEITVKTNKYVTYEITQATMDNKVAEIKLTLNENVVTYKVTFVPHSSLKKLLLSADGILERAYSGASWNGPEFKFDINNKEPNHRGQNGYAFIQAADKESGKIRTLALFKLNLNKLAKADLTKPVILTIEAEDKYPATNMKGDALIYDASDFVWSDENLKIDTVRDIERFTKADKLINTKTTINSDGKMVDIDITEYVKQCIENNNMNPTFAMYGRNNPGEINSFKFNFRYAHDSFITYNMFD